MISWDDAETLQRSSSALCRFVVSLVALPPLLGGSCALWARRWKTEIRLGQTFGQLLSQGALLAGSALASALLLPYHSTHRFTATQTPKKRLAGQTKQGFIFTDKLPTLGDFYRFCETLTLKYSILLILGYLLTCFIIHNVINTTYLQSQMHETRGSHFNPWTMRRVSPLLLLLLGLKNGFFTVGQAVLGQSKIMIFMAIFPSRLF